MSKRSKLSAILKARVHEALADPAPSIPQAEVFADLRAHHSERAAANHPSSPRT